MNLWRKLNTLLRASAQEPAARLVDANSIRIFEQELRDAEQAIARAKRELAGLMAEKKRLERDNDALQQAITRREQQAMAALSQEENNLAGELADHIADDENLLQRQQQQLGLLRQRETDLRHQLRNSARALRHYHAELRLARANRHAEQVSGELKGHTRNLTSHLEDMEQSMRRIHEQQALFMDRDAALDELNQEGSGQGLDERLREAGIDTGEHRGQQVLERLKLRMGSTAEPTPPGSAPA